MKLFSKNILLPSLTLFSYLFYLLWSAPLDLILQMYTINDLYIFNNSYVHIITIVSIAMFFLLWISSILPFKHIYYFLLGLISFLLILLFLYNYILPYDYGMFTDNNSLSPERSLLGFSKAYYVLDIVFILGSLAITYIIIKKQYYTPLLLIFLIIYSVETALVFSRAIPKITPVQDVKTINLSKNHPNIIYLSFDGLGPRMTEYFLTNDSMPQDLTDWSKDFTFYENTTSLSFAYTAPSFPSMYEGYDKTPQILLDDLINNKTGADPYFYLYKQPLKNFTKNLSPYATVTGTTSVIDPLAPVLLPKIYKSIPYFTRHFLANDYSWKFKNLSHWVFAPKRASSDPFYFVFNVQDTPKPIVYYNFSEYTHHPWSSKKIQVSNLEAQMNSKKAAEEIFYYNTLDVFTYLSRLIAELKKQDLYDNTKIIINSDHDTHRHGDIAGPVVKSFVEDISLPTHLSSYSLASLLMIKEFNTSNRQMIINNKFLTLADVRGNIEQSLGLTNLPDFINKDYQARVVNIPLAGWGTFYGILDSKTRSETVKNLNGQFPFLKLSNIYPYQASCFDVPIEDLTNVPPYEILD